jgi:DNA-binding response OmpR family regulator
MTKILLVEDDSNLREIYGARLEAEGYKIVAAIDGEEALAIAVKEKPDLIISDVMMPKISGFDMLDILRSTPDTKDVKIIMMTALSQDEDRKRGEDLGADRYIVKSQVTLDDVVTVVHELLSDGAQQVLQQSTAQQQADPANDDMAQQQNYGANQATTENIDQEVQQFVQNSPLMNGSMPQPENQPPQSNNQ